MKVEVGDWVKFRGMKRIYEVQAVHSRSESVGFVTTIEGRGYPMSDVEAVASRFWIKHAEPVKKIDRRGGPR